MSNPISHWRNQTKLRLMGTRCGSCKQMLSPPRKVCIHCGELNANKLTAEKLPMRGKVFSFSKIHKAPTGFSQNVPYTVAIIKLDKINVKLSGQIIGSDQESVKIGSKVKAVHRVLFSDGDEGHIFYGIKWELVKS